ncbi:4-hydroxythreonine-4-phosphate dehydrogenase PdxA [Kangiella sp. HZ709]|uniref:4-hydroxythreonine-4-phosphate dehydrogenase PdxA n=1 Tax=Kangiella sp. HZ709 TaxID=2666328 RepID=UPI0012AFE819|nr:4-hydroxythreonine-4-phosphate dehydrogenase PdxA [Kangiella sp. HZ709]MRX27616.1 4-hydroxythreonine-4-phosphate dehydrogenase PdxA [Kangiella sp. HZ709]
MAFAKILITAGEPAGIGPELVVKLAQKPQTEHLIVAADRELLTQTAEDLQLPLELIDYNTDNPPNNEQPLGRGQLYIIHHSLAETSIAGQLNTKNSSYVIETLTTAAKMAQKKQVDAILTAPVHKAILNQAFTETSSEIYFSGHTEFFAQKANIDQVVMMLATEGLRVALVTTHLPLKDVSESITRDKLTSVIRILDEELQSKFGIQEPKVLVLGLNPHAGESGLLGQEELDIIEPVLNHLNKSIRSELIGPVPADTAFSPQLLQKVDAVLAMYHDQGLPVLKFKGFGNAANITLGLPFIRTSVDHGTGLDIAGQNRASLGSMEYALEVTLDLIHARN